MIPLLVLLSCAFSLLYAFEFKKFDNEKQEILI